MSRSSRYLVLALVVVVLLNFFMKEERRREKRISLARRETVLCQDWDSQVDLLNHPCGPPGSGRPGGQLGNITVEKSEERKKTFEEIYEKSVW